MAQRTDQQNKALHVYLGHVAQALNDAGYTVQKALEHRMELDWTPELAKELIWRPLQKALLGKKSTTELEKTGEIDQVYEHLTRYLGEKLHIEHIEWPHLEAESLDKQMAGYYEK